MHLCLFEDERIDHLRPLVHTRAAYDLRLGMRTLCETTRDAFEAPPTVLHARAEVAAVTTQEHGGTLPVNALPDGGVLFVNGRYVADDGPVLDRLRAAVAAAEPARAFVQGDTLVAAWLPSISDAVAAQVAAGEPLTRAAFEGLPEETLDGAVLVRRLWHLLETLRPALYRDFAARANANARSNDLGNRPGTSVHPSVTGVNPAQIHLAPTSTVKPGVILNAEAGPIFIDRQAKVLEQVVIRGPVYIGPKSQVKIGAHLEGCAIGPWCKVGGEVHDVVMHSLSNKSHPGFLGHSYLGRWCNLGADTNVSNLRNDYGIISLYDAATRTFEPTGRQFAGLFMGDHSKAAINTMFNTGTVVGVFCNLFGANFPPRFIPSFTWGAPDDYTTYRLDKALQVAERVMARRDTPFTEADRALLMTLFDATASDRQRLLRQHAER